MWELSILLTPEVSVQHLLVCILSQDLGFTSIHLLDAQK